jgi:dolichol kinase
MSTQDWIGLGLSYAYAFSLLGLAEVIRRMRHYPQDFTRKVVHVGAGMWVFGVLGLFEHWYIGIIPFASFILLNYITYRYRLIGAVDDEDSTPGTVYFALSITILFVLFWRTDSPNDMGYIAAGAVMAMTWGDAMASLIGRRWGKHRYTVRHDTRSWEGSAAMVIASTIAIFLTLLLLPGSSLAPSVAPLGVGVGFIAALAAAVAAAVAEGISPRGTDNISVPLVAALVLFGVISVVG